MPIFSATATFASYTSISFLSASQSQSHLSPFLNFPHKFTVKTPWQWQHHHYHTHKLLISSSGNTQIDQNLESGLLQRPTPPDPQDDARLARVCHSYSYHLRNFQF